MNIASGSKADYWHANVFLLLLSSKALLGKLAFWCRDCLQQARLGVSLRDIHQHSIRLASEGIADLGLLRGKPASLIAQYAYREFYPHSVGKLTHSTGPLLGLARLCLVNYQ